MRRFVPFELRLRLAVVRRAISDRRGGVRFARIRPEAGPFPHRVCDYERRFIDYPGQEQVGEAKRGNQAILAGRLSGATLLPGEVFSIWRLAGRPGRREGYAPAAALKDRKLRMEVGGATCLLSTVLYNVGLLGGLEIVERHCHSIDQYGADRYFELGRDAAIEYGYLDLRLRNPHAFPVRIEIEVNRTRIIGSMLASEAPEFTVTLEVQPPHFVEPGCRWVRDRALAAGQRRVVETGVLGMKVRGVRRIHRSGVTFTEDLPLTYHHPVPAVIALG